MSRPKKKALVVGVGAERGLGCALAKRFAAEGHHVFVAGRTQEKIDQVVSLIQSDGGMATAAQCDATDEQSVKSVFDLVQSDDHGVLDLVVYNAGNSTPGDIREMDAEYFIQAWKVLCFGGFLVGREVTRRMLPGGGALIFTGASASLRGKSGFGAFNSGKAALRTFAQALAKEYGDQGLHVAHVIIDGGIAGQRQFDRLGAVPDAKELERFVSLDGLADAYWMLYKQNPTSWSFELDLRTALEKW